jgi:broad specificity phosphatase PhoE
MVRHGETKENKKDITQGQSPGNLTFRGRRQARKLAVHLKKEKFDIIYCSDLKRTKDTLKKIIRFHPDTPVLLTDRIRERAQGIFEGIPHSKIKSFIEKHKIDWIKFKPPGGETFAEKDRRAVEFLEYCLESHRGQNVLWVTHGGIIHAVFNEVNILPKPKFKEAMNCSVSIINFSKNKIIPEKINCTKHLSD